MLFLENWIITNCILRLGEVHFMLTKRLIYGLFLAMVERLGKAHSEEEWKNLLELYVVEMEVSVMQRSIQGAIR